MRTGDVFTLTDNNLLIFGRGLIRLNYARKRFIQFYSSRVRLFDKFA
jgi:hypothetical protein